MNHIEALLRRFAPDGVESRSLGEIGQLVRGHSMPKTDFVESGIGAIHYGQIYTYYDTWTATTLSHVGPTTATRLAKVDPGDVIITNTSENLDDVGKAVAWLGDHQIVTGGHATVFKHQQDPKFVSYWFQTPHFYDQKKRLATGTKVIDVSASNLAKVRIPLPPLEIQRGIVEVLDTFRSLEAELEAELEVRRAQYRHYRDALLRFTERTRWARLGDVIREPLSNGRSVPDGTGYPVLRLTALRGPQIDPAECKPGAWSADEATRFRIAPGDILVARGNGSKELIARGSMVSISGDVAFPDTMIRIRPDLDLVSQRFLYYLWESKHVRRQIERLAKQSSGVWKVSQADLAGVQLAIPPRPEQDEIVEVLDALDALVSDLSIGLPAELAARRKQYEYYRDKLLTFPEAS